MNPEARAAQLLKNLGEHRPPVNVWRIARREGVRIERVDLGDDSSGVLLRKGRAAVIGVNYSHPPNRQRFTVAHELGHYVLHAGDKYVDRSITTLQFRDARSSTGTDAEEREANQFAAALLMPAEWVRREFTKHPFDFGDDEALNRLCRLFRVSSQAMSFRLVNLGLLSEAVT
jgi:Zn-dependent peptidase ImmA (M78 family)